MCYCIIHNTLSLITDDLAYAMELLNDSEMNSVERDLVEADVHNTIIKLLDSHSGNPFIQEHGLAALGHLGNVTLCNVLCVMLGHCCSCVIWSGRH